jgi:hypothetical protein
VLLRSWKAEEIGFSTEKARHAKGEVWFRV